ncbi:MAG: pilus assembly FimT family protein [Nitrospirota bacterium]
MRSEKGASLVELATVIAIVAILATIAIPYGLQMQQNAVFRQEAMAIGSMLREARSRTVSFNRENRVELDLTAGANRYRLVQGNASSGSTAWATVVTNWVNASQTVVLAQAGCLGAAPNFTLSFNPNGSADSGCTINVQDTGGTVRRTITVTQNTGRVRIQ